MKLLELYAANQGEGARMGEPSAFIRLAGCSVGCNFCDTKFSWEHSQGEDLSPADVIERAAGLGVRAFVLTGGEPLEHPIPELIEFFTIAIDRGFFVTTETSGTLPRSDLVELGKHFPRSIGQAMWSVSPKLEFARTKIEPRPVREWLDLAWVTSTEIQFKYVVRHIGDVREALSRHANEKPYARVDLIFQPVTSIRRGEIIEDLREKILANLQAMQEQAMSEGLLMNLHPYYIPRFLPQLHALIYGQRRGV